MPETHEHLESAEHAEHNAHDPFNQRVAVSMAIVAALLAGISLDGKRFFYTNTLRQLDTMPAELRWSRTREEWISCFCCPPNVARTIARAHTYAYGRSDRGLWVHLFGGSALDTSLADGRRVKLKQETDYPWDGRVRIAIESAPEGEFSLFVRVPCWATRATLAVNGTPVDAPSGQYAEIRRSWKTGDATLEPLPTRQRTWLLVTSPRPPARTASVWCPRPPPVT